MPVREVGIGDGSETDWMRRVGYVEQETVAFAGTTSTSDRRIHGDVMALSGTRPSRTRRRCWTDYTVDHGLQAGTHDGAVGGSRRTSPATCLDDAVQRWVDEARRNHRLVAPNVRNESAMRFCFSNLSPILRDVLGRFAMTRRRGKVVEDAGRADDCRLLGMRERNLDHLDAEERRVRILVERGPRATCQLTRRTNARRTRDVDVDVVRILWIDEQRVRMRSAAGLDVADVLRRRDIADVEDAEAAQAIPADCILDAFNSAIDAAAQPLTRDEEQIAIDRHVAL